MSVDFEERITDLSRVISLRGFARNIVSIQDSEQNLVHNFVTKTAGNELEIEAGLIGFIEDHADKKASMVGTKECGFDMEQEIYDLLHDFSNNHDRMLAGKPALVLVPEGDPLHPSDSYKDYLADCYQISTDNIFFKCNTSSNKIPFNEVVEGKICINLLIDSIGYKSALDKRKAEKIQIKKDLKESIHDEFGISDAMFNFLFPDFETRKISIGLLNHVTGRAKSYMEANVK